MQLQARVSQLASVVGENLPNKGLMLHLACLVLCYASPLQTLAAAPQCAWQVGCCT
jgi:hypothetical protein